MSIDVIAKRLESLTPKQRDVLNLASQHMTSKQIARELDITPKTVDRRIESIRAKLDNIPRSDLLRLYSQLSGDGENSPRGISPLSSLTPGWQGSASQSQTDLTFRDSLIFDERAEWDRAEGWLTKEAKLSNFGPGARVLLIVLGALAIMALAVLTFAASIALSTMLES